MFLRGSVQMFGGFVKGNFWEGAVFAQRERGC